jgi:hypothetical protein
LTLALKILTGLFTLIFLALGIQWMFTPEAAAGRLGIELVGPAALNTARGDLGGLFIAGCILIGLGLRTGEPRWLQAAAVIIASVATGRVVGLVSDGFAEQSAMALSVEIVMILVVSGLVAKLRSQTS